MSEKIRRTICDVLLVLLCAGGLLTVSAALLVGRNSLSGRSVSLAGDYDQQSFRATVEAVDAEFRAAQQRAGLEAAAPADWLQIARRISLALTGTVPSLEEIRTLQQRVPEARRIRWWTDHCLSDRRSAGYLAERLARAQVGTEDGPFGNLALAAGRPKLAGDVRPA